MNDYVADNGVVLTGTDDGSIRWHPGISQRRASEALREYFQAERDEELGRWRDPENPDWIIYQADKEDAVWVFNEREGGGSQYWTRGIAGFYDPAYTGYSASHYAADRYFQAHPEPKPWEAAKPGEVWLVTLSHCEPQICQVLKTHKFLPTQTDTGGQPPALPLDHPTIITAHKIWPEPRIGGAE